MSTLEFRRGKDKKPRKTRSDKGKSRRGFGAAVKEANEGRQRRRAIRKKKEELELKVLESQAREIDDKEKAAKRKKTTDKIKGTATLAGAAGAAVALGTKKGRSATKKALGKAAAGTGKLVGKGVNAAGSAAVKGATTAGKAAGKAIADGAREAAEETKTAASAKASEVKKAVGQAVSNKKAADKAKVEDLKRRLKNRAEADKKKVSKLFKRRGKKRKDKENFHFVPVNTINFASKSKKKKVKVRSFRRKDGTLVKASVRRVKEPKKVTKTVGQRIGDVGKGLIPIAAAAMTGAQAISVISDTQLRRRQVRRDLSAIGEARKFLGVSGSAGSGFKSVASGVDSIRNSRTRLGLENRKLDLFERDLNQRDLNRVLRKEELKLKKARRKRKKK